MTVAKPWVHVETTTFVAEACPILATSWKDIASELASYPDHSQKLREEKGPGIHCLCYQAHFLLAKGLGTRLASELANMF